MKLAALLLVSLCAATQAQTLTHHDLPLDSQWYLHVNTQLLRDSALTAPFYAESLGEAFADIQAELGIDLGDQVKAVTVFGFALPMKSAAVVLHGALSAQTRTRLDELIQSAAHYAEHDYGGARYVEFSGIGEKAEHRNPRLGEAMLVHYAPERTLVTNDLGIMQKMLDPAMAGSLSQSRSEGTLLVLQAQRSLVQAGLDARAMSLQTHWDSSLLNHVDQAVGVISERDGGLDLRLEVLTATPETASYVLNIAQGLVSLKALSAGDDEPWVDDLLQRLSIAAIERRVTVDLQVPPELARRIVDDL